MSKRQPNPRRGERYKRAREHAKLTQAEVAARFDVDKSTVSRWETGENRPQDPEAVAELYGTSPAALEFGVGSDEEPPYPAWKAFLSKHAPTGWRLELLRAVRFPDDREPIPETYERLLFALQSAEPPPDPPS